MDKYPSRKPRRLKQYEYDRAGSYFVTICVKDGRCVFGDINKDQMVLNEYGECVCASWNDMFGAFPDIDLSDMVVMPNHVHAVIGWDDNGEMSLGKVVRHFKALAAKRIHDAGCAGFEWQRNYYDHVIRDEKDMLRVREYIANNPLQWALDEENPEVRKAQVILRVR